MSEQAARFVLREIEKREGCETELIDVRELGLTTEDAGGAAKIDSFAAAMTRSDALVIVTPEYNHGYPGMLKHALDTNLKEYVHKAVGICGVSAGGFRAPRAIPNLLPGVGGLGLGPSFFGGTFSEPQEPSDDRGANLVPAGGG